MIKLSLLFLTFFIHACCPGSFAQTTANTQTVFDYVDAPNNFVKNPHARVNTLHVTSGGGAVVGRVTGSTKIKGLASHSCDTGTADAYCQYAINTPTAPYNDSTESCEYAVYYSGTGAASYSLRGGSQYLPLVATTSGQYRLAYLITPCSASPGVLQLIQNTSGDPAALEAFVYYGPTRRIERGVRPNVFTAKVSSAGVVSDETGGDWINGNFVVTSTSTYTGAFSSGFFTSAPNCFTTNVTVVSGPITSTSSSQLVYQTYNAAGTATASATNITCTKTGADYVPPAIVPNMTAQRWSGYIVGSGWAIASATFANFPSGSSIAVTTLKSNNLTCSAISGGQPGLTCTGATAGSTYLICADTSAYGSATSTAAITLADETDAHLSTGVLNQFTATTTSSNFSLCSQLTATSSSFGVKFRGRIASGTVTLDGTVFPKNFNIVQINQGINSAVVASGVYTDSLDAGKIESATLLCAGTSSVTSGRLVSSLTNVSSGRCTITFAKPFQNAPRCWVEHDDNPSSIVWINSFSATTTGVTTRCLAHNNSTTTICTSYTLKLFCADFR